MVLGGSSATEWVHIFRGAGFLTGLEVVMVSEDLDSSDQGSFQDAGIPAVQLFTGPHGDYHRPGDSADKIDSQGLVKIATLTKEVLEYLASREEPLTPPGGAGERPKGARHPKEGRKVSLGTVPDFAFQGKGVRLDGTVPGSPAEKAGLRQGDVITNLADTPVNSLRDLSAVLKSLSPGDKVTVVILREGREQKVEAGIDER